MITAVNTPWGWQEFPFNIPNDLSLLQHSFQERSTKECGELFDGSGIPCGPINNIKQVFEDPQVSVSALRKGAGCGV